MVSASSAVPLSLDKSYNWPLLNHLILRFWPLGLRHGSDWLVSLLCHQYILITFVDTLTNSLHGTRPTELAVLLHIYCLKHNMQGGAAHTLVHAVLRHCHGVAFMVHSHRCELSTVARASVRNKQKHTSIRIEYKMKNNNQLLWC